MTGVKNGAQFGAGGRSHVSVGTGPRVPQLLDIRSHPCPVADRVDVTTSFFVRARLAVRNERESCPNKYRIGPALDAEGSLSEPLHRLDSLAGLAARTVFTLIDTVCGLEHDPTYRKQRAATMSNRHSRERVDFAHPSPAADSGAPIPSDPRTN